MEILTGNDIEIWIHWLAGSIKPVAVLKQMKYCSKQRRRSGAEREAAFKLKSYERQSLGWSRDKFEFPSGSSNDFILIDLNRKRFFSFSSSIRLSTQVINYGNLQWRFGCTCLLCVSWDWCVLCSKESLKRRLLGFIVERQPSKEPDCR